MVVDMRILNEYIRRILLESSKIETAIDIAVRHRLRIIHNKQSEIIEMRHGGEFIAQFLYDKSARGNEGAYVTSYTQVDRNWRGKGLGALLYDIMIELAGEKGIVSDRSTVQPKAVSMYRYFFNNPDSYEKILLDPKNNRTRKGWYTDRTEDDTGALSYVQNSEYMLLKGVTLYNPRGLFDEELMMSDETIEDWKNHPLAYVYIKKDQSKPTITKLSDLGIYYGPVRAN